MARLIDKDAVMNTLCKIAGIHTLDITQEVYFAEGIETAVAVVDVAPTVDAVEVVRCKDCMFFQPYEGEEHKGDCEELVGLESCVYEDDYCSYGAKV